MKKCKRLVALTMAVLIAFVCFALPSLASSTASQYGLEASIVTDKESYKANEDIHVTVTVKNANDFKVENVSMESLLPETLTLKDGSSSTKTVDLEPGETLTLSFTAVKDKEEISATETESQSTEPTETETVIPSESETVKPSESESVKPSETETVQPSETETIKPSETETQQPTQAPTTEQPTQGTTTPITTEPTAPATTTEGTTPAPNTTGTQPTTGGIIGDVTTTFPKITTPANSATTAQAENPDTGDSMSVKTLAIAIIALLSVIVVVIILMYKYKKQTTKIISLVMCVAISASAITGVTFFTAEGVDDGRKSFTVEKVITVDGEETNVSAEVKYQENTDTSNIKIIDFYADKRDVFIKKGAEITFTVKINTALQLGSKDVMLYDMDNNFICYLNFVSETSDIKTYSNKIFLNKDNPENVGYVVKCHSVKSEVFEICFYRDITEEEFLNFQHLSAEMRGKENELRKMDISDDEIVQNMFEFLKSRPEIRNIHLEKKEQRITFTTIYGISGVWAITDNNVLGSSNNSSNFDEVKSKGLSTVATKSIQKKIALLCPYRNVVDNTFNYSGYEKLVGTIANQIDGTVDIFNGSEVSLSLLKQLGEYSMVFFYSHGGLADCGNSAWTIINGSPYTWTGEMNHFGLFSADFFSERIIVDISTGRVGVGAKFYDTYYHDGSLSNTFFHLASCNSMKDDSIANALISKGAVGVEGYHGEVTNTNEFAHVSMIMYYLMKGNSIDRSIDLALQSELVQKTKQENCYLRYVGNPNYRLTNPEPADSFAGGKGTINDPYQIANAQQLDAVRYNLKSNFVLINDIDLSEYENWVPIGGIKDVEAYDGFQGMFDGKGHTIKNLKMDYTLLTPDDSNTQQYTYGLFANTQNSPGIRNINLEDVDVTIKVGGTNYYSSIYVGGISALASEIENCTTKGNIKVLDVNETRHFINVGGICARVNSIAYCTNEIDFQIDGTTGTYPDYVSPYIGGIVARSESKIIECTNKGDITCREGYFYSIACGGISAVGSSNGSIMNSQNYGMIDISAYSMPISAGGIIGILSSNSIDTCINYGIISARAYGGVVEAGGILGGTTTSSGQGPINKSVNYGSISAIATSRPMTSSFAGGIAGRVQGAITISNCYNACDSIVSKTQDDDGSVNAPVIARIGNHSKYATISFVNNHSIASTTLNGIVPLQDIAPDQQNGGSMTKAEIEKAIQELGFELPGELPAAS